MGGGGRAAVTIPRILHPEYHICGEPAVAVAQLRGELSADGIYEALRGVTEALGLSLWEYGALLLEDPLEVARRLEPV